MSDDFGTISARRGDRAKEIEVLRKHRESLVKMLEDVDAQLRELEVFDTPGARPLVTPPGDFEDMSSHAQPGNAGRVLLLVGVVVVALAVIGVLVYRASSDRGQATTTATDTATTVEPAAEDTTTETSSVTNSSSSATATIAEVADPLRVAPASQDYGLVRKGTRVTRQFEIANDSDEPISINLARSACRCLYYEHSPVIAPKGKDSITVTVDGAKAKAGTLRETIRVTSKSDAAVGTSFDVIATVR